MRWRGGVGGLRFLWAIVVLQVGTWFAMSTAEPGWLGSWRQGIDNGVGTVVLTGPLLSGLVAGTYASLRRTSLPDLAIISARRPSGWFGPAAQLWLASLVGLATVLVVLTVRAGILDVPTPPRQFLIVPVGVLVLGVHALIGMVIGLRTSPRAAAVLAACVSFGLFILSTDHLAPPSFATGGVTGSMYGEQYRIGSVIALCVFAVASAAAVAPWVGWSTRGARIRWGVSALAVGVVIALAHQTWPDLESRLEASPVSYRCGGDELEICVVRDRPSGDLDDIARRLFTLAGPLRAVGVSLPPRWKHNLYGQPLDPTSARLFMSSDAEAGGRVADADLIRSLVEPAECPRYSDGNEPPGVFGARVQILNWLTFRNGLSPRSRFGPWYSSKKGDAWVRITYEQLRRCDFDAVRRP